MSAGRAHKFTDSFQRSTSSLRPWERPVGTNLSVEWFLSDKPSIGTMTGLGTYFKEAKPSVYRIA